MFGINVNKYLTYNTKMFYPRGVFVQKQKKQFLAISGEISTIIEFFGIFLRLFLPK